jgi:predicted nucleotidyltransferase
MVTLLASTGNASVDNILRGVIGLYELTFPGRIRGHYLVGSYASGRAVGTSDLDMWTIFKGSVGPEEQERHQALDASSSLISPILLDTLPLGEDLLLLHGSFLLKRGSLLLYGEDIRERVLPEPLPIYLRRTILSAVYPLFRARHVPEVLAFPLEYPDSTGIFYGYDYRTMTAGEGRRQQSTKGLVVGASWAASVLIVLSTGRYVIDKADCIHTYVEFVSDEWASFLTAVHQQCREVWDYHIPDTSDGRATLRELCAGMLAFENHFLTVLRGYLLREVRNDGLNQLFAARQLSTLLYPDAGTLEVLLDVKHHSEGDVQELATIALGRIKHAG